MKRQIFSFLFLVFFSMPVLAENSNDIKIGLKADQVIALKGRPYYESESYANKPGEQVWLYTKKQSEKNVSETKMTDPQTNWPTLHRTTIVRTCDVGDIFVEVSQGVVKNVKPADSKMTYGPCSIETTEEFLPIVDGVPATVPTRTTKNTKVEGK